MSARATNGFRIRLEAETHWLARKKPRCVFISTYPCQYSQTPAAMASTAAISSIHEMARPMRDLGVCADPGSEGVGRRAWRSSDADDRDMIRARRRWDSRLRSSMAKSRASLPLILCSRAMEDCDDGNVAKTTKHVSKSARAPLTGRLHSPSRGAHRMG